MILKTIIFFAFCYIGYRLAKRAIRAKLSEFFQIRPIEEPTELVQCSRCGAHVDRRTTRLNHGQYVCLEECQTE